MTQILSGADIRGFYAALGVQLPGWAGADVSVRCFADPGAHSRGDRDPSCSINLTHGAWNCHGCGASGGPFDAAVCRGHTARSAIELMILHGLAQRRATASRQRQHHIHRSAYVRPRVDRPGRAAARFTASEADLNRWRQALESDAPIIRRLVRERGWSAETMYQLELGIDRGRITIPVRDNRGHLVGLLRYRPWASHRQMKMRAAVGSRRQLLPHPTVEQSAHVLLVEGEPDMIATRSCGLPAIALPGVDSWKDEWAPMFAGRRIAIVMDCDRQGRAVAQRVAHALADVALVRIVDLAPDRNDGYDLTDWLLDGTPNADTLVLGCAITGRSDDGD